MIFYRSCVSKTGTKGYCRSPKTCVGVNKHENSTCADGLVCCGRGEISRKKCFEYGKLVYATDDSVINLLPISQDPVKEDTCAMIAVPLIVGGEKVIPKEFPHQAVFGYGDPADPKTMWECGGTLISEQFVLTAAHCVLSGHLPTHVRFGIIKLKNDTENEQLHVVQDIIMHPKYHRIKRINDIALVKLTKKVKFTPYVRPACLDYTGLIEENRAIATGFGLTSFGGGQSSDLLKVTIDILDKKKCHHTVRRNMKKGLKSTQICAGVLAGGKDTCQGDSGGPLQTIKKEPYCMYNLIGLTSYGAMCGFKYSPAVYTRVWSFIPWIENIVWPDEKA